MHPSIKPLFQLRPDLCFNTSFFSSRCWGAYRYADCQPAYMLLESETATWLVLKMLQSYASSMTAKLWTAAPRNARKSVALSLDIYSRCRCTSHLSSNLLWEASEKHRTHCAPLAFIYGIVLSDADIALIWSTKANMPFHWPMCGLVFFQTTGAALGINPNLCAR